MGPKQGPGLRGGLGQCSDPQGWKSLWGLWGVGFRLKEQKAQVCPPPLVSEGRGPHLGGQQPSWARVGRANALVSSPAPPVWEGPSHLPLLISPQPPSCAPKEPQHLQGALEGRVLAWELSRLPGPSGPGDRPPLLSCSSWRVPPACLSLPPWPQGC